MKLRVVSSSGQISYTEINGSLSVVAEPGATYAVVDENLQVVDDVVLTRDGDALAVTVDGEVVAQVDEFYAENSTAAFDTGTVGTSGETVVITPSAIAEGVVWEAAGSSSLNTALLGWLELRRLLITSREVVAVAQKLKALRRPLPRL
ncbi:hypothetical protein KOI40_05065 [Aestuariicella sp. G3-2]|uniref:hypothetical protein n=1 Tax=Pseudomaricurvus albidus TaxID=2842452 RepID=UPI001C0B9BBF|nr:hypothetical protein [Aestuariicella albida]MBU3069180.1 hypothetical protein [Aestuariicella albida]